MGPFKDMDLYKEELLMDYGGKRWLCWLFKKWIFKKPWNTGRIMNEPKLPLLIANGNTQFEVLAEKR